MGAKVKELLDLAEDWAKKRHEADGSADAAARDRASAAQEKLSSALSGIYGEGLMGLVEDYARKIRDVDFWSGKVKSSLMLDLAYEARSKLMAAVGSLENDASPRRRKGGF